MPLVQWNRLGLHLLLFHCREPAREIPPMTRSCGEAGWASRVRPQGFPLDFPEHLPPKTRVCLLYCVMLSTYSSDINRGLSPHHLFLEKVNFKLLDNKSPGHNTSVSIQKPLCTLTAAHVIVCGLPTMRGTGSLKHPRNVGASKESK